MNNLKYMRVIKKFQRIEIIETIFGDAAAVYADSSVAQRTIINTGRG